MIFRSRQKTVPLRRQIIIENNVQLEQVDNIKFLRVYIDQHLTWKTHINFIAAKISKSVGILYKAKHHLPSKFLHYITRLFIHILYLLQFNLGLYVCQQSTANLLTVLQKRAVRAISKADYNAPSKPLFANLKILDVFSIYSLQVSSFMYLYHNGALPLSFTQIFQT